MKTVHPTAVLDPQAHIGQNVTIGPYAIIGPNVTIDDGVTIDAHAQLGASARPGEQTRIHIGKDSFIGGNVQIAGITTIGEKCDIRAGTLLGGRPQDKGYNNEPTELIIGDRNVIGEMATIHRGTVKAHGKTVIGNDNFIMGGCHVAHDCQLGNHITMANDTLLAGHVSVGDYVTFGGDSGVHQFVRIGNQAMIGGGAIITADILPYCVAVGGSSPEHHGAVHRAINKIGMERRTKPGSQERLFSDDDVRLLFRAYKLVFTSAGSMEQVPEKLRETFPQCSPVQEMARFIEESLQSRRGIAPANDQRQTYREK